MKSKKINNLQNATDILNLYEASFPKEERSDFFKLLSGIYEGFELHGIYEDDKLIAFVHFNNTPNFIHINYFAVKESFQNQGYGSQILTWLKNKFPQKAIVLDVEVVEENAKNNLQRSKRISFYKHNNFKFSNYTFKWAGSLMTPMYFGELNQSLFIKYIQKITPTICDVRFSEITKNN